MHALDAVARAERHARVAMHVVTKSETLSETVPPETEVRFRNYDYDGASSSARAAEA